MRRIRQFAIAFLWLTVPLLAQGRLWVLRASGELVEYDPATFAIKQKVKLPAEAGKSWQSIAVNRVGQILFAPATSLPLSEEDPASPHKIWFWNGHAAATLDEGVEHKVVEMGSNQAVTESAPAAYLSADGNHLYWFANQQRRLQREGVDLSVATTWQAWQTDPTGANRQEIASVRLPDCRCKTGTCEESCPSGAVWVPSAGLDKFFLMTQVVAGQTEIAYKASTLYQESSGMWKGNAFPEALRRVLDAAPSGNVIVEAIPDTGCCGWSNQSNDQTLVHVSGKTVTVFDERATYKNPDYDVSFYTSDARLSPDLSHVAMTVTATAGASQPIQEAEEGQANPEESKQIHKSLLELPAVLVKSVEDPPRQIAFVPHATLVGWISEKELLMVEDHLLVAYNVASGSRRKSSVRVEDAERVFLP
jgi:hypothetical protein